MALHWNTSACQGLTEDDWPVTECMIWLCMICGVGVIDEKSAPIFFDRIHAWESATGPINTNGVRITAEDVRRRIGMRTNASTMSDAAFKKKLILTLREQSQRKWAA